jgi:hypothetical protein
MRSPNSYISRASLNLRDICPLATTSSVGGREDEPGGDKRGNAEIFASSVRGPVDPDWEVHEFQVKESGISVMPHPITGILSPENCRREEGPSTGLAAVLTVLASPAFLVLSHLMIREVTSFRFWLSLLIIRPRTRASIARRQSVRR